MSTVIDVLNAWLKTYDHNKSDESIAQKKLDICNQCPNKIKGILDIYICDQCYCPISHNDKPIGKLYADEGCPLGKF